MIYATLQIMNSSGLAHQKFYFEMDIISESVRYNIDNILRPFNRSVVAQNEWTPLVYWLVIGNNVMLEKVLQHFKKINAGKMPNVREQRIIKEKVQPINDQVWDKDHIAEIEGEYTFILVHFVSKR